MTAIWRGYDREALDAQYNNRARARVPGWQAIVDGWRAASDEAMKNCQCHANLASGPHERERLDIFPATAGGLAPALVFIHGGYWQSLDRTPFRFAAPALTAAGIAFVPVGYPLAPAVTMDELVASVRQTLAWVAGNGAEYGVDPARLLVCGHSAGGHLTALAMATDWARMPGGDVLAGSGGPLAGLAISGLYELEPVRLTYLNENIGLDAETAARNSPAGAPGAAAGTLALAVGGVESAEFLRQQRDFHAARQATGRPGAALELPGLDHFTVIGGLADPQSRLFGMIQDLLDGGDGGGRAGAA